MSSYVRGKEFSVSIMEKVFLEKLISSWRLNEDSAQWNS
jgi:hypothetical protein